jgi:hypothetical protein
MNSGRNRNSSSENSEFSESVIGVPRIAWSIKISVNQVNGKMLVSGRIDANIAIAGMVIPENVNAITE